MIFNVLFALVCVATGMWLFASIVLSWNFGVEVPPLSPAAERCFFAGLYLLMALALTDRRGTR